MPEIQAADAYAAIDEVCLRQFRSGTPIGPYELMEQLTDLPCLPMHSPIHHYLMPALLLTVVALQTGTEERRLIKQLQTARQRALTVPGGYCGNCGNCGAAVGVGIFFSVVNGTSPRSHEHWSEGLRATGLALLQISSVEGPRCCKRNCYLALGSAVDSIRVTLGISFDKPDSVSCRFYAQNLTDCKKEECPFYPAG